MFYAKLIRGSGKPQVGKKGDFIENMVTFYETVMSNRLHNSIYFTNLMVGNQILKSYNPAKDD